MPDDPFLSNDEFFSFNIYVRSNNTYSYSTFSQGSMMIQMGDYDKINENIYYQCWKEKYNNNNLHYNMMV